MKDEITAPPGSNNLIPACGLSNPTYGPGFKGYSVNNYGVVFSAAKFCTDGRRHWRNPRRTLKGQVNKDGSRSVFFCEGGTRKSFLVHRLVAYCFIARPNGIQWSAFQRNWIVVHIDGDKSNNRVTNLKLVRKTKVLAESGRKGGRISKRPKQRDMKNT